MAEIKNKYAGSVSLTIALAALASSSTLLVGRASTAIANITNLYLDAPITGQVTTGTSPTAGTIEVWAWGALDDTPTYPDGITGTDANKTMTSDSIKFSALRLIASMETDTTSDQSYSFAQVTLKELFGEMPTHWGVFVVHDTVANLNATASKHFIKMNGITKTIA